jgi:DNA (cytosine-5)-methyltransferase 1
MKLLDLFCGGGGASMGYYQAGFTEIVGVDNRPQPRYPFRFVQADALEYLAAHGHEFDVIHASPPCQAYSLATPIRARGQHPDLVQSIQQRCLCSGRSYVIENVPQAPLTHPVMLCGLLFDLPLFRHRIFDIRPFLLAPPHPSHAGHRIGRQGFCTVAGGGNSGLRDRTNGRLIRRRPEDGVEGWKRAMGIDWMTRDELAQAIPPAYTAWIGKHLLPICHRRN